MGRGTDRFLGVLYVLSAVWLVVAVVIGTVDGRGPNVVLALVLAAGVVALLALAASSLGPSSWTPSAMRLVGYALSVMWLLIAVTSVVAPGLIADPHSSRGPTTESGARQMGVVMLATLVVPWLLAVVVAKGLTLWFGRRRPR